MGNQQFRQFNLNPLMGFLIFFLIIFGLFYITKSVLSLLWWIAPILFVVTLVVDYKVVVGYGKTLMNLFKRNPLYGILGTLLSFLGIHLVVAYLFGKAILKRKVEKMVRNPYKNEDGYTEFELVEELELPTLTKSSRESDRYDELFDE